MYCWFTYIRSRGDLRCLLSSFDPGCQRATGCYWRSFCGDHATRTLGFKNAIRRESATLIVETRLSLGFCDHQRVMSYISSGKEGGATVHTGGERDGSKGYFVQPTIFTDVQPHMQIAKEEIFGPVAAIFKFKTEEGQFGSRSCLSMLLTERLPW